MKPIGISLAVAQREIATTIPGVSRMHVAVDGPRTTLHLVAVDEAAVHALAVELGLDLPRESSSRSFRWLTASATEGDVNIIVTGPDTEIAPAEIDEPAMAAAVEQARAAVAALQCSGGHRATVCRVCEDTHRMELGDRTVMCTHCPTPCQACRRGGNGAFCETTPCACACHAKASPGAAS